LRLKEGLRKIVYFEDKTPGCPQRNPVWLGAVGLAKRAARQAEGARRLPDPVAVASGFDGVEIIISSMRKDGEETSYARN
jgi:hypothetical protein